MARYIPKPPAAGRNKFEKMGTKVSGSNKQSLSYYSTIDWAFSTTSTPASSADAVYNAARNKVESYLLTAKHAVGWDDVVGNDRARTALLETIEHPVTHKDLYAHYGMKPSKGVLLFGAPGCGKTMFGKAAATAMARLHKTDVEFMVLNGPSIQSMWVGQTEEIIRNIFAYARAYKAKHGHQLILFLDEADALLPNRSTAYQWEKSNVATFLAEMDGMEENGAFVILATNRPDAIDAALLRDGRCDRKIKVERPTYDDAIGIARNHLAKEAGWLGDVTAKDMVDYLFDPMHLVMAITNPATSLTHHFTLAHTVSGAMVVGLINRAKGIAFRRDMAMGQRSGLTIEDVRAAVDEVLLETKGINNDYALREFVETVAIPFEEAKRLGALN